VEKPTALFELSALVAGVEPKLNEGFGNVGTVVDSTTVDEVGGAPKLNVDVSDTAGFTASVLVTVEAGVFTDWAPEVSGAPKLKVRLGDAVGGFAGSVGRPRGVDLTTAGVGTVAVEDTVTVDSAGSLNVTNVSGFLGRGAEFSVRVDATEEEEVVPVDASFEEVSEYGNPPMDEGVGTGPSAFSPMVKAKPPTGFLADSSFFFEASSASFSFKLATSLWSGKMLSILFILFFCSSLSPASSFAPIKRLSTFLTGVPRTSAGLGTLIPVTLLCSTTGVLALSKLLPTPPPSC